MIRGMIVPVGVEVNSPVDLYSTQQIQISYGCSASCVSTVDRGGHTNHESASLWHARTSNNGSEQPKEMDTRAAEANFDPEEPQCMIRCVNKTASPASTGTARMFWKASLLGRAARIGSGASSSSGSPEVSTYMCCTKPNVYFVAPKYL
jgi:hypothetical protein